MMLLATLSAQQLGGLCNYTWYGTPALCTGAASDCTTASPTLDFVRLDKRGNGAVPCLTGDKVLCKICTPDQSFLPNWMGHLMSVLGDRSVLDLSLPGTHDSMSYDLSTVISDNANEIPPALAWVAHQFGPELGVAGVGPFIREQAQTQGLSMKGQLEAGARFIDLRMTYSASPNDRHSPDKDWYSLHLSQNNNKIIAYLKQARDFLDQHPSEILVLWLSRHGSSCKTGQDQYPGTTPKVKQKFWGEIKTLFGDLLFDRSAGGLNATTVNTMVTKGQRVVIYATDYAEFTGSDTTAYDSCVSLSNNLHGGDIDNLPGIGFDFLEP